MSDTEILPPFDDEGDERRERTRNRALLATIFVLGVLVALWVGYSISSSQEEQAKATTTAVKAEDKADQAQAEKFTLAQQVAAACAGGDLDPDVQTQLCSSAREVVKEGPRGAQGIPGIQGVQGVPGKDGADGKQGPQGVPGVNGAAGTPGADGEDGATGPQGEAGPAGPEGAQGPAGPEGPAGKDGAVGPQGPAGRDGQPPVGWIVFGENGQEIERCNRADPFDPQSPTYVCTETQPAP